MSDANAVLAALRQRRFAVRVEGARLMVQPASLLTDDDKEAISVNRDELYRLVANDPAGAPEIDILIMWPNGMIADKTAGTWDEGAGWWRRRGEEVWHAIPGRSMRKPKRNPRWQALGCGWYFDDEQPTEVVSNADNV